LGAVNGRRIIETEMLAGFSGGREVVITAAKESPSL
jgi:hypothetical protein